MQHTVKTLSPLLQIRVRSVWVPFTRKLCVSMTTKMAEDWPVIAVPEMRDFITRSMEAVGTRREHAEILAELLVTADYRGHYSHGLNRLDMYVKDMEQKMSVSDKEPHIIKETVSTAWVDGCNLLGPVVGKFCIDKAIEKAKHTGIGWVVAKETNHFGIAGWYSKRASEQGMIGMAFTNTSPLVVPTRAKQKVIGTNALAVAAPGKDKDSFELDMATSAVSVGKVELNARKNLPIPSGWGCDSNGMESTDAQEVATNGGLFPLGGAEVSGGYKGYGLILMVEIFSSILAGATYGPNVRQWKTRDKVANLGQCFVAIDPAAFAPGFEDRLTDLNDTLRSLESAEENKDVLVPGDPEKLHMAKCDRLGGIPYHPNQVQYARDIAEELNIKPPILKSN